LQVFNLGGGKLLLTFNVFRGSSAVKIANVSADALSIARIGIDRQLPVFAHLIDEWELLLEKLSKYNWTGRCI
jgi:hypothetical protein